MMQTKMQQRGASVLGGKASVPSAFPTRPLHSRVVAKAAAPSSNEHTTTLPQRIATGAAGLALGVALSAGAPAPSLASEFDLLAEARPTTSYYVDDANALSKSTKSDLNKKLKDIEEKTGYRIEVLTLRKLEYETDAFAFVDKILKNWYTEEELDKKGAVLVMTAGKEGAVSGGNSFMNAVGEELLDSIVGDQIPIYTEQEKYNQTVESTVDRLSAQLEGREVPDGPQREDGTRRRTFRTKAETEKSKNITSTVVLSLLLIACVVPMLQYYGYVAKD